MMPDFVGFPKMARWFRECYITEKIDGTNAQIYIDETGRVIAASRHRWVTPGDDNYGFALWVAANREELLKLGPGRHFGEWWGKGIQRGYGMEGREFSLFNVARWVGNPDRPACCGTVPILWSGPVKEGQMRVQHQVNILRINGSIAKPGFMQPEGIIFWHCAANVGFKVTLENDEVPKTLVDQRQTHDTLSQ